jgi:diguanylate cyclase (GGDEF)-like protein
MVPLLRLGLLLGSVLYLTNFFGEQLDDMEAAAPIQSIRLIMVLVMLAAAALTHLPVVMRHAHVLLIATVAVLSYWNSVITGALPDPNAFYMALGQLVLGIVAVLVAQTLTLVLAVAAIIFVVPNLYFLVLAPLPQGLVTADVLLVSGCVGMVVVSYYLELDARRAFKTTLRLIEHAETDSLTGLPNRRRILELADYEVDRAKRYGRPMSVLMIDIDHFKSLNDAHGHRGGDRALKALASATLGAARAFDSVGRLGGEEFLVVLPETDADAALVVGERLRRAIAALEVVGRGGAPTSMTVSVGVVTLRPEIETLDALIDLADAALYAAKAAGRDCTRVHDPALEQV